MSGSAGDGGVGGDVESLSKSLKSLVANLETLARKASELEGLGEGNIELRTVQDVDTFRKSIIQDVRLITADVTQAGTKLAKLKPAK